MFVEIELLPWGLPHGVPSMLKNPKKVQIYPNLVITLLEVNSLTLNNLHFARGKSFFLKPSLLERGVNASATAWGQLTLGTSKRIMQIL